MIASGPSALGRPAGHHDDATDALRDVVRLPRLGPVLVGDRADPKLPDPAQPEGLEMPQRALGGLDGGVGTGLVGDVGDDRVARVRILADHELVVGIAHEARRLHDRAGRDPAEDLGDGLHGLHVGVDGQLEPAHGSAIR